ncbi:MAG: hypothetical protein IJW92_02655 [Clostridia bacterium]|nr:hypothetical protein [Clostridia bacterium]
MEAENTTAKTRANEVLQNAADHRRMVLRHSFFSYARATFRETGFYALWQRGLGYFRSFRVITVLIKILATVITVVETGALVLLSTVLFLIVLPLLIALMLGILLTALLESRRTNRMLKAETDGKRVDVLFLPTQDSTFFKGNITSRAADPNCAVIVVSPHWLKTRGLNPGKFYCTARKEAPHVYLVRRYYFFSLKKRVLSQCETAYWY